MEETNDKRDRYFKASELGNILILSGLFLCIKSITFSTVLSKSKCSFQILLKSFFSPAKPVHIRKPPIGRG